MQVTPRLLILREHQKYEKQMWAKVWLNECILFLTWDMQPMKKYIPCKFDLQPLIEKNRKVIQLQKWNEVKHQAQILQVFRESTNV